MSELYEESWCALCRSDFWTYRTMIRPNMFPAWWQMKVSDHLTQFWRDMRAGKRPKLVLGAPPQHGKSDLMKDFCSWIAGKDPALKIIFASYADDLGQSANLQMQRTLSTQAYQAIFPLTRLSAEGEGNLSGRGRERRTTTFLEFVGRGGSFRNTAVNGAITGFGLDLGVIDDPIKGRAEAQSKLNTSGWLSIPALAAFGTSPTG